MSSERDEDISKMMKAHIYTPQQHANIVFNQSLQMVVDWTELCASQCFKSYNGDLIQSEKECLNTCGYNVFKSYFKSMKKHGEDNKY